MISSAAKIVGETAGVDRFRSLMLTPATTARLRYRRGRQTKARHRL
jgi:hypothetical protein